MTSPAPEARRVFLALWPDDATRGRLARLAARLPGPGRPVPEAHLHLTLAFPGTVPAERVDCLAAGLGRLEASPIRLVLHRLGHFASARVTWLGPERTPDRLRMLAERARALCADCRIELEPLPFVPHVTLLRGTEALPEDLPPIEPIEWRTGTVALVESGHNGRRGAYRVLARVGPGGSPASSRR
ncbi:RNA 2',3'-cyclic phosphodiesterase [Guyparkeria sp.]|uniref:RNA 2',3'-cyclic phosphodiesterase n=1 Tax=Guyparkeria sp. TaxID=2035736 RepID=UPI003970A886